MLAHHPENAHCKCASTMLRPYIYTMIHHHSTRGGQRLHSELQTLEMSSILGRRVLGKVDFTILYHLMQLIARSTWMRRLATRFVFSTSDFGICSCPLAAGGMVSFARRSRSLSFKGNPRSAITSSPGSSRSTKPHCWTICLSKVLPPHALLM